MRSPIQREPLGIRKLDVQQARREYRREAKRIAESRVRFWFEDTRLGKLDLTIENVQRLAECLLEEGWEDGVRVGAERTRDRVAESLKSGRLVKTR